MKIQNTKYKVLQPKKYKIQNIKYDFLQPKKYKIQNIKYEFLQPKKYKIQPKSKQIKKIQNLFTSQIISGLKVGVLIYH